MAQIQYEYAINDSHQLFHIKDVTPDIRKKESFTCPGCGLKMLARLGQQRIHHFVHDGQPCGLESYTHKVGKLIFFHRYRDALETGSPVNIYADVPIMCDHCSLGPCTLEHQFKKMDLTKRFEFIDIEKKLNDSLIPDILLTDNEGTQIFVEIHVTSPCSKEKLQSGKPIIEIHLESPEDFHILLADPIQVYDKISFFNFPWIKRKASQQECGKNLQNVFIVYPSGKCYLPGGNDIINPVRMPRGSYFQPVQFSGNLTSNESMVWESERAYYAGVPIKSCFLCRHHTPEGVFNGVYCSKKANTYETKKYSAAGNCPDYIPDPEVFNYKDVPEEYLEQFREKMKGLYESGKMSEPMREAYKGGVLTVRMKKLIEDGVIRWAKSVSD